MTDDFPTRADEVRKAWQDRMTPNKLPPLPEPIGETYLWDGCEAGSPRYQPRTEVRWKNGTPAPSNKLFTADQTRDYAVAYAEALRQSQSLPAGAVAVVLAELERATRKFPTWPTDPLHAVTVLGEEFGELTKAVLQSVYEPHKVEAGEVRSEAVQTAAMALRFLMSLDRYEYTRGVQHEQ